MRVFFKNPLDTSDWIGRYFRFFIHPNYTTEWIMSFQHVQPLESMNEIAMHMGNVMEGYLRRTKGPKKSK